MIYRRLAKILMPPAVSAILLIGVVWWVSPARLLAAASVLDWRLLVPATALMVAALYVWDALCLPYVYRVGDGQISYWQALHLRGLTYLGGSLNYELGQAALAWGMARLQGVPIVQMLGRSVLLAYHDLVVLLATGCGGALLTDDPRVVRLRPYITAALAASLLVGGIFWLLPSRWRSRFRFAGQASLLEGWSLMRSLQLVPLRFVYFGILLVYATIALAICRLPIDWKVVLSTVPLVILADGLPSFAGLGTRETTLQLALSPGESNATLVAMSLFWTIGMIIGRALIAMVHLWLQRTQYGIDLFAAACAQEGASRAEGSGHA